MMTNRRNILPRLGKLTGALLATTALLSPLSSGALAQTYAAPIAPPPGAVQDVVADPTGYGGQLALPIGGTRILRFNRPIGQVLVGNPKVGDIIPLGERTIYVLGKSPGPTSLTVMPRGGGAPLATLDVRVGYDVENIRRTARDIMPGEALDVSARGDGVVLTGTLSSSAAAAQAAAIAEQYAPGHVVNLTKIRTAEQVMLSVRVAEVQRSALQKLGLKNFDALWDTTGAIKLVPPLADPAAVANLLGRTMAGKDWTFQALFDALETHGFASTLAEPNLVALSGQTAVFFAGGEFPVPVPQTGLNTNTITIEYKQYGVSIGFTPTVVGDTINLIVAPEVSALDQANAVVLQGFRIPGITTRRAKTTVELRNGQSFAVAGLIKREFTDNLNGIPGVQRVPIFGALARSTSYQNNETEVVIIVTAHLARPTRPENLIAPTDVRMGPGEAELLFTGKTDEPVGPAARPSASLTAPQPLASGGPVAPPQPSAAAEAAPAPAAPAAPALPAAPASPSLPAALAVAPAPKPVVPATVAATSPTRISAAPLPAPLVAAPAPKPVAVSALPRIVAAPQPAVASVQNAPGPKPVAATVLPPVVVAPQAAVAVAESAPAPTPIAAPVLPQVVATPQIEVALDESPPAAAQTASLPTVQPAGAASTDEPPAPKPAQAVRSADSGELVVAAAFPELKLAPPTQAIDVVPASGSRP